MALVDLWKNSPEQLRGKTVQQILAFAGSGRLLEGNDTSHEFREYLAHIQPEQLEGYANQCLNTSFPDSGFALQDLVNQVGRRLGFQVQYGRYRGTPKHVGFDGLWETKDGDTILIEVKTTDAYRLSLDTAANYRKTLIREGKLTEENSSILYVVGRNDTGDLEAQVRGSRHAWDIRLISVEALLRLLRVKVQLADQHTLERMRDILMPREFTRVDGIIDLVFSAAKEVTQENVSDELPVENTPAKKEKKFTPVAFRDACVARLQKHLGESLVRQSSAIFATPDESIVVLCAISREYEKSKEAKGYWFAFHPSQQATLSAYPKAWVAFGCGSEERICLIPLKAFEGWLPRLNTTELEEGRRYWHVLIANTGKEWTLETKRGYDHIAITNYFVPMALHPVSGS